MSSEAQATSDAASSPTVTRDDAIQMLHLAIFMIEKGKHEAATNQLHFLIDELEVATAIDARDIAREAGCSEHYLCQ